MHIPNESAGKGHRERNSSKHRQSSAASHDAEELYLETWATGERMLRETGTTELFKTKFDGV